MSFTPANLPPCPVIGHEKTRAELERELPSQPVLLLGPESTGKWQMALWLAAYHAPWYNQRLILKPRMDAIRDVRGFLSTPPSPSKAGSSFKVVAINLNGAVTTAVQDALLKDLEEPPDYARFIMVASRSPLATISSRCTIWRWGALTDEEVAQVLVVQGVSPKDAAAIAPVGRGRVAPALAAAVRFRPAKIAVLGVVLAIATRDSDQFERAVRVWGETEDWMLRELLGAAASGNSTPLFSTTERQIIGSTAARRGIALLAATGRARPQVAVRALAVTLMQGGNT
jgi:DNA polymerase III, delta subunit